MINILKSGEKKLRKDYYILDKYAILNFGHTSKVINKKDNRIFVTKDSVLGIIKEVHTALTHKGERKTHKKIAESYANIPRKLVSEFIKQCERCVEKSHKKISSGIVVKPITAKDFNDRGQVSKNYTNLKFEIEKKNSLARVVGRFFCASMKSKQTFK